MASPHLENSPANIRLGGAGIAAGDVDGDGWCDLFFCSMGGRSALYRNRGNWRFEEITAAAGLACEGQDSTGAVFADVDGDGDLDLLINSIGGGTRLFLNDGKGRFTESLQCGLIRKYGSTSLALADIDGNGTLDLYVANFAAKNIEDRPNTKIQVNTIDGKMVVSALDGVSTSSPELTNRYFIDPAEPLWSDRSRGHSKWRGDEVVPERAWPAGVACTTRRFARQSLRRRRGDPIRVRRAFRSGAGDSRWQRILVAGWRGAGDGNDGVADANLGAVARRDDHYEPRSSRGQGNYL